MGFKKFENEDTMDSEMTKALVFDLDDTLLNRNKRISPINKKALLSCINNGIRIIIATSRPKRAVAEFLDADLLSRLCLITLNGTVYEINGKTTKVSSLEKYVEMILSHARFLKDPIISVECLGVEFSTNKDFDDEELLKYQNATRDMLIPMNELDKESVSKIAVDGCGADLNGFIGQIECGGINAISAVNGTFVNIVGANVDKSHTLLEVLETLNIESDDVISFGDDVPDIEMMKITGKSIAMGNAKDEVKKIATDIIGDCNSDAISQFINEKILK